MESSEHLLVADPAADASADSNRPGSDNPAELTASGPLAQSQQTRISLCEPENKASDREQSADKKLLADVASPSTADPPLARRSAPLTAASACLSSPNTSRVLYPVLPSHLSPLHGTSFHTANRSAFGRTPGLATSAELSRRLRGLLTTAVNFRDVELMPPPQPFEGEMGLMEQLNEADDADAATGSAAAAAPAPPSLSYHPPPHSGLAGDMGSPVVCRDGSGGGGGGGGSHYGGSDGGAPAGSGSGAGTEAGGIVGALVGGVATGAGPPSGARPRVGGALVRKNKLVLIMVGLPGRGKTFLCNKLCCYLNWLGHATRHFNVGLYRRRQKSADEMQDAQFFDHCNEAGVEARNRALHSALDDLMAWLRSDVGQVAVFDATNTTESRRNLLRSKFHGIWQYLFIETICSDPAVLEQNYRNKMQYSPDYQGVDTDRAVSDFLARIAKYEQVYEPIEDRTLHYIKLIDMVTGRGYMDINRISGYLPGKIVFFLMQVCKAGLTSARRIWLTRHGESEYNQKGLIGGDSCLSERGERYAEELPAALVSRLPQDQTVSVAIWTSTLKRTIQTARFLPFPKLRWKALDEIDAGICDGMTYEQIAEQYPHEYEARKKDKLRYRYPAGESYMDVIQRVEPVIIELERERECVAVVAHQAVLRAVYAYFMNVPSEDIPRISIPLHTLIELTPMPDGTMSETRFPVDIAGVGAGPGSGLSGGSGSAGGPSPMMRSPAGTSAVDLTAQTGTTAAATEGTLAAAALAAVEGASGAADKTVESTMMMARSMSPLSSMNSGGSFLQDPAVVPLPASPSPEAPFAVPSSPPEVESGGL